MKNVFLNELKEKLALDEYIAAIKIDVKSKKYLKLVSAGLRATNFDALSESEKDGAAVTGKVVLVNFSTVPDSTIEVSDSELKSYLAKHSDDFKAEDSRDIEYVLWDVKASKDDSLTTLGELDNLKQGFESAEDDSAYAVSYSDQKQVEGFRDHGNFKSDDEVGLFSAEVGTVYGPIAADGGFGLFKIKEKTQGENFYNFSQIQLNTIKDSAGTAQRRFPDNSTDTEPRAPHRPASPASARCEWPSAGKLMTR